MGSVAEWVRSAIAPRTRDALGAKRAAGQRLGRRSVVPVDVLERLLR